MTWLIPNWLKVAAGALVTLLLAFFAVDRSAARRGAAESENERAQDHLERNKDARNAAEDEKRETDGLSDADKRDRLRGRDSDWSRM